MPVANLDTAFSSLASHRSGDVVSERTRSLEEQIS